MPRTKTQVRSTILAARRSLSEQQRQAESAALGRHLEMLIAAGSTICAYVPVGREPGSLPALDALVERGVVVLLPVARTDADGEAQPLRWGRYRPGALVEAPFGLREPAPPWLPPEHVAHASTVLVPALAVDRFGTRLGRGAGFYDRTLPLAAPTARLVAVVRDDEVVDHLPADTHDVPMTHAVTPQRGAIELTVRE
ncbi:5-formyltetrahydrofolate cyclo-ligase [Mycolicibacterium duvalii]|uniref:5-formyltetrahydrofolate cyclo-ligase n=1 Tax=Mycolicibacterium duvalii TaxID=39688 RepID=A0A7I7K8P7_9MYCO|nr:5-formyltetrahydrofolate cyclo-ligase [Mycolicibacterium duvalii]MCV7368354.1 5-formyltetrahydrofolate cyclo-ligase [Mycolicibacterium duvalii]PEG41788.1 5-formyltetrahydrofolate cyclo-ligase [Mycolicibacterium duvalii]BBX20455.1 5-formyltetrahydrofolate cyclo-ligase [Mycolicibacterium duvalii]